MRLLALLVLAFALAACAPQTTFVKTNAPPRALAPRAADAVLVFTTSTPDRPYAEVGIVSSRVSTNPPQSRATLLEAIRTEAARQGCDGLIIAGGSAVLAEGTCIVFK
jgi:uncharacterized lipoprotein YajG